MKPHNAHFAFAILLFTLPVVLGTCSPTGIDEDAAVSTAPPEAVAAFRLLDDLEQTHQGALLEYFTAHAYNRGYADALDVCAVACATFTDSLCGASSPVRTNLHRPDPH